MYLVLGQIASRTPGREGDHPTDLANNVAAAHMPLLKEGLRYAVADVPYTQSRRTGPRHPPFTRNRSR